MAKIIKTVYISTALSIKSFILVRKTKK